MDEAGLLQVSLPVEQKQQRPHEHRGAYRDQVLPDPVRLLGIVLGKQHVCRRQAGFATLTSISPAKLSLRRRRKERPPSSIAQRTARRRPPLLPRWRIPLRPSEPARYARVLRTLLPGGGGSTVPAAIPRRMPCRFRNGRIRAWLALPAHRASRTRGEPLRGCLWSRRKSCDQLHWPPSSGRHGLEKVLKDSRKTTRSVCSRGVRSRGFAGLPSFARRLAGSRPA